MSSALRFMLASVGWTGHAFPAFALARELDERGHEVTRRDLRALAPRGEEMGADFSPAQEQMSFPGGRAPATDACRGRPRDLAPRRSAELRPDVVVSDMFTLAPALAAEVAGIRGRR